MFLNHKLIVTNAGYYELKTLENHLTRFTKNYRFQQRYKLRLWDGKETVFRKDGILDLGLWKEIAKLCQEMGYEFKVENKAEFPLNREVSKEGVHKWLLRFFRDHKHPKKPQEPLLPRDYQLDGCYEILRNRYCNAEIATSGGKTLMFSMFAFYYLGEINPDGKILLIVPSITLVNQFYDDIVNFNEGAYGENTKPIDLRIQEIMSDKPRKVAKGYEPNLYIATYQSLDNYPKDWFKQFDAVVADEAHTAKAKTLNKILKWSIPHAYYRWGMSGSYPDENGIDILKIQAVTGPIIKEVKAHELQQKGYISNVKIKAILVNHGETDFHVNVTEVRKVDGKAAYDLEKSKVQVSEKRKNLIAKILSGTKQNSLILFHNIDHGKALFERMCQIEGRRVYYIDGNVGAEERVRIKAEMNRTDSPAILVASYGTLSTGVSIDAIVNVVFADSFKSEQRIIQSIGRALRLHSEKSMAYIFDIVDIFDANPALKQNVLYSHYLERTMIYRSEKFPYEEIRINL